MSDAVGVILGVALLAAAGLIAMYLALRAPLYRFGAMSAGGQPNLKVLTKRLAAAMLATTFGMAALIVVGVPIILLAAIYGALLVLIGVSAMAVVVLSNSRRSK